MGRPTSGQPDDVVLFVRSLGPQVAGGTRAVLARASLYAAAGRRVTLVVTGVENDEGWARSHDLLHPDVRVAYLWRDGPSDEDRARAAAQEPMQPPRVPDGDGVTRRRRSVEAGVRVRTFVADVLRTQEVLDPESGVPRSFVTYREDGTRSSVWHFVDGGVVAVDEIDAPGRWVRHYVVDGRARWLTADPSGTGGLGPAVYPSGDHPDTDFAGAIAAWLDRDLVDSRRVVVFADGENAWQRTLRLMRHPGLRGVSVLHNSHLDAPYDVTAPTKPHWEGFFSDVTNVTTMVCLTHRQRRDLLERYPGLPLHVLRHAAARPRTPRVTRDPRRVVSLGRLAPQKQLDHLLRAFALVLQRVPDARLDVYGDGPSRDELAALASELQLAHAVRFLGRTDRALEAFASARVAVMTSLHEGLPLTLTEAMSVGTPFVAYDCNYGPAEVLRDGENGFLVPMGDVGAVADRIVRVLQDDRLARRLGRAARRVTKEFSYRRYRSSWLELLDDAARASSSSTISPRT